MLLQKYSDLVKASVIVPDTEVLREYASRNDKATMAYHVRAGYDDEYRRMITYVKEFNMQRVGYVYLEDTSPANQTAMKAALDQVGITLTVSLPLNRNAKSFDAEVDKLMAARLDCVLFTTNASPIASIVQKMSAAKYAGFYFSSSFAGQALIELLAGDGAGVLELLHPRGLEAGQLVLRFGQLQPRLGAIVVRLVGPGVDDDEDVVLLDELSFVEQHLLDVSGRARAHLNGINRLEPACKLVPVLDSPADDFGDGDLRRTGVGWSAFATSGQRQQRQHGQGTGSALQRVIHLFGLRGEAVKESIPRGRVLDQRAFFCHFLQPVMRPVDRGAGCSY